LFNKEDQITPKDRKERDKEGLKKKILDAAAAILIKDGYERLSIRKIAAKIEYTSGIIYHYFQDKREIISTIVDQGYRKILAVLGQTKMDGSDPVKSLKNMMHRYIDLMLENREMFRAIIMNDIEGMEEKLYILSEGITQKRESLQLIARLISMGIDRGLFRKLNLELTAQILWTATHGLISRLVIEQNVPPEQRERLIDQNFDILWNGLKI
jgi:AcrR family transcriptional regulator